ncbi:DNA mismatch repair protein [Halorhabdus sp. CBA1104]|uniref:MutS-related protein n=1 Tax=Halorhabdus sp. CBA1104 TaxID=1380432 RepID=UPI0012B1B377|nr:DNA mismatch repair protein [Halorhabdus sp. CBA1104]QGN07079.1 DNA mismatch repair protein [Halorhabdus sp. CBA1104]
MDLEDYWGVGPKTRELLAENLGVEAAIAAIESGDLRTLTEAGLSRGRATRILRRTDGAAMDVLATRDARDVYKSVLDLAAEFAVTQHAADSIRLLTPKASRTEMEAHLETVIEARDAWTGLSESDRERVTEAFEAYDSVEGGDLAGVRAALALKAAGMTTGPFETLADLDTEHLEVGAEALDALSAGGVAEGADERLDDLRSQRGAVEDMAANPERVIEAVREAGVGGGDAFRETFVRHVVEEAGVDVEAVRDATPREAANATDFVAEALRTLATDRQDAVTEREQEVSDQLETTLSAAREEIDRAVAAVDEIALAVSLARFAIAFDLTAPTYVEDRDVIAVENADNLSLLGAEADVQPITYAVGDHTLSVDRARVPPDGDRVAVLTGANSGGKTTLLETLCQVQLLAQMGLPVPAETAEVGIVDVIVFHRRHASFNAGVLESTLRSVVPPLTDEGRTLMLVDEFEAITEPGSAADLLHGLVTLTVDRAALGVFVTHLADDLEPLPQTARTDGIFAEGLTTDLELEVDYQPRFETVGRSTPEFIVSRLVADAEDRTERSGFRTLAEAVGEQAVQRTLSDAEWSA